MHVLGPRRPGFTEPIPEALACQNAVYGGGGRGIVTGTYFQSPNHPPG